ncbi:Arrestin-related trafficking adapter 3 [Psilocybe cubensis]|uniref:Arrestin-related trafficking adapter 3 n=2 Tax=Psilocybe cubensis TaxID=181762 RepID=A0ACB8HEA3_PSICU|nr:Arrestin-related trafficking adapter 3 [Psilocybe cubensis]KAH9485509.1 Arrestin-related trafficking adapter 3 [Psilocybe cubensis]
MHSQTHSHNDKTKRSNSVSIRLTESAVFLRTDGAPVRRGAIPDPRTSLVRGLLILDLVKPTKLTSIEVELSATTANAWPEGIGARRIDVTEEHRVFRATTTYFNAGKSQHPTRRTASIGPGILYSQQYNQNLDFDNSSGDLEDDFEDDWDYLRDQASRADTSVTRFARSRSRDARRTSTSEFNHRNGRSSSIGLQPSQASPHTSQTTQVDEPSPVPPVAAPVATSSFRASFMDSRTRPNRRMSIDNGQFQRMPLYEAYHQEDEDLQRLAPIPPYSPFPPSPMEHNVFLMDRQNSGQADSPMFSGLRYSQNHGSQTNLSPSIQPNHLEPSLSRHTGLPNPIMEHGELEASTLGQQHPSDNENHDQAPRDILTASSMRISRLPHSPRALPYTSPMLDTRLSASSSMSSSSSSSHPPHTPLTAQDSPTIGSNHERGRKGSRFSFAAVSNIFMDAVRPKLSTSKERGLAGPRESSVDGNSLHHHRRGRTMERECATDLHEDLTEENEGSRGRGSTERGRHVLGRILKDMEHKPRSDGWKEFKKGTYTYPISFTIPANAPPTMQCDYGSVGWKLKASVHRPGAFKSKMTAVREVITVACPTEEDTEDTENIIVERQWEQQLQYLISISGRSFYIGGTVPVTFTFMPLTKMRIHRLSVYIEERVDYYTNMRRIARTDPLTRFTLLSIKGEGKGADPILPLDSDSPDAFRQSPLYSLVSHPSSEVDLSELASNLMGPGPWTFHQDLQLPKSCNTMHFTNKNRRSNIVVSHMLKVVIRVERGDDVHVDGRTGKRKLFDIVVQTPVLILSCRCNPEWTSLPRYDAVFDDSQTITPNCPCQVARVKAQAEATSRAMSNVSSVLDRVTSRQSSDSSGASAAETTVVSPSTTFSLMRLNQHDALLRSNDLYERLMSGQETESGEAPPAYDASSTSPHGIPISPAPARTSSANEVAVV